MNANWVSDLCTNTQTRRSAHQSGALVFGRSCDRGDRVVIDRGDRSWNRGDRSSGRV